jgi:hypothetical protein
MGAFKDEMGLEASDPMPCAATDPAAPALQTSPSGFAFDPALDEFQRPPLCDASVEGDGDGATNEIDPALVDHMEFYLLNYSKPGLGRQTQRTRDGLALLQSVRCTECHVRHLVVANDRRVADVATVHDFSRGIFDRLFATPPCGHDGRSMNLEEVILRHGGEAQRSRDAFASLDPDSQRKLIEFLESLVLFPPDDTASNLNPGNRAGDPQDPANHGSIALGALVQISEEGAE